MYLVYTWVRAILQWRFLSDRSDLTFAAGKRDGQRCHHYRMHHVVPPSLEDFLRQHQPDHQQALSVGSLPPALPAREGSPAVTISRGRSADIATGSLTAETQLPPTIMCVGIPLLLGGLLILQSQGSGLSDFLRHGASVYQVRDLCGILHLHAQGLRGLPPHRPLG